MLHSNLFHLIVLPALINCKLSYSESLNPSSSPFISPKFIFLPLPPPKMPEMLPKYVKLGYQYLVDHILTFLFIPIMAAVSIQILKLGPEEILTIWNSLHFDFVQILCSSFLVTLIATVYFMSKPRSIYLVDYACYKPPITSRVPFSTFMEHSRLILKDNPKSVEFQMRIL